MKIGVIGSGMVGGALGKRFAGLGHQVIFGVRDPKSEKMTALLQEAGPNASAATLAEAAASAEVIILATSWSGTEDAVRACGDLSGKPLLDATNPLNESMTAMESNPGDTAAHKIQKWATNAKVVKIFNTTGFLNMLDPVYDGQASVMFYAGDDADAKAVSHKLATELGFDAIDTGPLAQAFLLENLAMLWISLAYAQKMGPQFAFSVMRRS